MLHLIIYCICKFVSSYSYFLSETLCARYSNTAKASTEYHWLIEVTVHNILLKVSCLCRYLRVAIYLNLAEHFILSKMSPNAHILCGQRSPLDNSNEDMFHQGKKT